MNLFENQGHAANFNMMMGDYQDESINSPNEEETVENQEIEAALEQVASASE